MIRAIAKDSIIEGHWALGDTIYNSLMVVCATNLRQHPYAFHTSYISTVKEKISPNNYEIGILWDTLHAQYANVSIIHYDVLERSTGILNILYNINPQIKQYLSGTQLIEMVFRAEILKKPGTLASGISILRITKKSIDWIKKNQSYL